MKLKDTKPAAHSKNAFRDEQAVSLLRCILSSHERVMPKIDSQDKWPNIDGYLEIQNEQEEVVGMMAVQVKKLPQKHRLRFRCPVKLLMYAERMPIPPLLFLAVDVENNKIYWLHLTKEYVVGLNYAKTKPNHSILLIPSQFLDYSNKDYIDEWMKIVLDYKTRHTEYELYKQGYEILAEIANEAVGQTDLDFIAVHRFLDKYNSMLDFDFPIIKRIHYPNQWKMGIAIYDSNTTSVGYSLYPIPGDKNDVQIKKIDTKLLKRMPAPGKFFVRHFYENPILSRPESYARELINEKIDKIVEHRILDHGCDVNLAIEFIFAFIDRFQYQLGLERKDAYQLEEVITAYQRYLPIWIEEAVKQLLESDFKGKNKAADWLSPYKLGEPPAFYDPDFLISFIGDVEKESLTKKILERINSGETRTKLYPIGNRKYGFNILKESLDYLNSQERSTIERLYKPKDFGRIKNPNSSWFDVWAPEDLQYNLQVFWNNVIISYKNVLERNFTHIADKLSLFADGNKIFVWHYIKENPQKRTEWPSYHMCFLKGKGGNELVNLTSQQGEELMKSINNPLDTGEISFQNKLYDLTPSYYTGANFTLFFAEYPMLDFIYSTLQRRLKRYFHTAFN